MTQQPKKWKLMDANGASDEWIVNVAGRAGISRLTAKLLWNRGLRTEEELNRFLDPTAEVRPDPFLMRDMDAAVERILRAVAKGQKIVIFGDYDVDGVTAVTLLTLYLREIGAETSYYIPSREKEGYGVSVPALEKLAAENAGLIVTVDTGITANKEAEFARTRGLDMVITDHHACREPLPDAVAVVNPHRADCGFPFRELAGVGVVFCLAVAIARRRAEAEGKDADAAADAVWNRYVDLAAIGTVADVMPLVGVNRRIVAEGLVQMKTACRPGLEALIETSARLRAESKGIRTPYQRPTVTSGYIGFGIAPRINAAGRIDHADKAVQLLLSENAEEASGLAAKLCEINRRRQELENKIAEEAYEAYAKQVEEMGKVPHFILLADDGWMQGVIGIVSSRLTEKYGVPAVLVTFDGATRGTPAPNDVGKGSGRSVPGIHLVDALAENAELLERFGGHELAAGLSVKRCHLEELREKLDAYAARYPDALSAGKVQEVEAEIDASDLSLQAAEEIERLEPFGTGNPQPVFLWKNAPVLRVESMGNGKHTKLTLGTEQSPVTAVWFAVTASETGLANGDCADVLCRIGINEFRGTRSLQLTVQTVYPASCEEEAYREECEAFRLLDAGETVPTGNDIPGREDVKRLYLYLRERCAGQPRVFCKRTLWHDMHRSMTDTKLRYALRILEETGLCRTEEPTEDECRIELTVQNGKVDLETAPTMRALRAAAASV